MSVFSISELPVGATVHMVGIGGISMSALASMLLHFGYKVTGSDRKKSDLTDELEAKGVKIFNRPKRRGYRTPEFGVLYRGDCGG